MNENQSLDPLRNGMGGVRLDRYSTNTPEMAVCEELGIEMLWNIGGEKEQSSSDLVNSVRWYDEFKNGV